jgi:U4/U6.U5 tri-snRNP-associated protein 2
MSQPALSPLRSFYAGRRQFRVTRLPRFLVLHSRRFSKNQFFIEKNPTLVTFPIKGLDPGTSGAAPSSHTHARYDLVANVVHEGKAGEGSYKAQVHRQGEDSWYEVQDLSVVEVLPQMVALSEAYLQVYEARGEERKEK